MQAPDTELRWTTSYHGVSHRYIQRRQCTITTVGRLHGAIVFGRRGSGAVVADAIEAPVAFATREAAEQWCERIATRHAGGA
jgi:hypothetical protein